MNLNCADLDRVLRDGSPDEWIALERHAAACSACAEEIRAWRAIGAGARELRDYTEDPALWSRIASALVQQANAKSRRKHFWTSLAVWRHISLGWQAAFAGALAVALAVAGTYLYIHRNPVEEVAAGKLLKSRALAEVEHTEREYIKAIDKLAAESKAQLDDPASPLMASYREKLIVLDSAISELRAQTGQNPSNAHLRYQLLAMYQQKQETLQEVSETKR